MIELLNAMGDDLSILNAKLAENGKHLDVLDEDGIELLHTMAKNNEWDYFVHPQLQFKISIPLFIVSQWYKNVVGFIRSETRRRYISDEPSFFYPEYFRPANNNIKPGSKDEVHPDSYNALLELRELNDYAKKLYMKWIEAGISAEQARIVLPLGLQVDFIETGSLIAYAGLYSMRFMRDNQKETVEYIEQLGHLVSEKFPYSWNALTSVGKEWQKYLENQDK